MKILIISILLFFTLNAQTNYYVSNVAKGTEDASSWDNADLIGFGLTGAFNTGVLTAGDTLFIDGGTDSLIYNATDIGGGHFHGYLQMSGVTGTADNPIVITKGKDAGHNGEVWFVGDGVQNILDMDGTYVKFIDINFSVANYAGDALKLYGANNVTIENCNVYINSGWTGYAIYFGISDSITIRNNRIETLADDVLTWSDAIGLAGGTGGHIIDGNTIIHRGNEPTSHKDVIQIFNYEGSGNTSARGKITISNNFVHSFTDTTVGVNCFVYLSYPKYVDLYIYNNVVTWVGESARLIDILAEDTLQYKVGVYVFNNTMYVKETDNTVLSQPLWFEISSRTSPKYQLIDTVVFKNNIVVTDSFYNVFTFYEGVDNYNNTFKDIQNNRYYSSSGVSSDFARIDTKGGGDAAGIYYSFATWQSAGFDSTSTLANPITFTDLGGFNTTDYYTITGRDSALDLSSIFTTDILGNTRTGSWDIGALEYQGSTPPVTTGTIIKDKNGKLIRDKNGKIIK